MYLLRPNDTHTNAFAFGYPVATVLFTDVIISHISIYVNRFAEKIEFRRKIIFANSLSVIDTYL